MVSFSHIVSVVDRLMIGKKLWSLEIQIGADESLNYYASELELKNNSVSILQTWQGVDSKKLIKMIGNKPVQLLLTGRGILTKNRTLNNPKDIGELFPGVSPEEIVSRIYENGANSWVAICKRELLTSLMAELNQNGVHVVNINLSASSLLKSTKLFAALPNRLGYHKFKWNEKDLMECDSGNQSEPFVDDLFMGKPAEFALGVINGLDFFKQTINSIVKRKQSEFMDYLYYRSRILVQRSVLTLLFVSLLLGTIFRQILSNSLVELNDQTTAIRLQIDKHSETSRNRLVDEEVFHEVAYNELVISKKLDDVAASIPTGITLEQVFVHPSFKQATNDKISRFDKDQILVQGLAIDVSDVNQLLGNLGKQAWIRSVELLNMKYDLKKDRHVFELMLRS